MIRYRRTLLTVAIALIVALLATFGYIVAANPSWSPIDVFKGDGKGTSNAEKAEQEKQAEHQAAEERLSGSLNLIPQNAVVVSHANLSAVDGGNAWWTNYKRLLPPSFVVVNDLPDNLGVTSLTYASFPTSSQDYSGFVPLSNEIILTAPADKGDALVDYISSGKDSSTFVHYAVRDDIAYVVITDISSYDQISQMVSTEATKGTFDNAQDAGDFNVDGSSPAMFINVSDYFDLMTAYKPDESDFTQALLSEGLGLQENTTWLGTTTDQGVNWDGRFLTGGINAKSVDPKKFGEILNSEITLIKAGDSVADGVGTEYGYVDYGMSTVGDAISVGKGDQVAGAVVNPHDMGAEPVTAKSSSSDLTIVFSPQMFQSAYQGVLDSNAVHTITATISGDSVKLTFDFFEESDFAAEPAVEG